MTHKSIAIIIISVVVAVMIFFIAMTGMSGEYMSDDKQEMLKFSFGSVYSMVDGKYIRAGSYSRFGSSVTIDVISGSDVHGTLSGGLLTLHGSDGQIYSYYKR